MRRTHVAIIRGILAALALCELIGQSGATVSLVKAGLGGVVDLPFFAPAMLGAFACQLLLRPRRGELAASAAVAAMTAPLLRLAIGPTGPGSLAISATALGIGAILVLAVAAARSRDGDDRSAVDALLPAVILPAFVVLAYPMVYSTVALWPTTYDHRLYVADAAFGAPLSFLIAAAVASIPLAREICLAVYVALPLALMSVHALRRRHGIVASDALVAFVAVTMVGYAGYLVVPVAGPVFAFGDLFPLSPPDAATVGVAKVLVVPAPRNCMPSLHSAWALLVWWHARPLARTVRAVATLFLAITLLATVALGFHYVVDVVAAFSLTTAVQAWATRTVAPRQRLWAMAAGLAMTLAWMVLVTWGTGALLLSPLVPWLVAAAVVAVSCELSRRVHAARCEVASAEDAAEAPAASMRSYRGVRLLLVLSSLAAWTYWAIYAGALGFVLGAGVAVRSLLGAVALFAVAAGVAIGARWRPKRVRLFEGAAMVSLLLAACSGLAPAALVSVTAAAETPSGAVAAAAALLLPPGLFAGVLLTLLARALAVGSAGAPLAGALALAVSSAALSVAALVTAYLVIPSLHSGRVPTMLQVTVAVGALVAAVRARTAGDGGGRVETTAGGSSAIIAGVVGVVAAVVLATQAHLLTAALTDTVYTRTQVFVMAGFGLALGAATARRVLLAGRVGRGVALVATLLGGGGAVAATLPLWSALPGYFASFDNYAVVHATATTFAEHELVRLVVAALMMSPAAAVAGGAWVLVGEDARGSVPAFAATVAAGMTGLALGLVANGFVLLPALGSIATLKACAALQAVAAVAACSGLAERGRSAPVVLAAAALLALIALVPSADFAMLAGGSGATFASPARAVVAAISEGPAGLVTVGRDGGDSFSMIVNGHRRGIDGGKLAAAGAAAAGRAGALLVGLGDGREAKILLDAGFRAVVVVEPVGGVVDLARAVLRDQGGAALDDARVTVEQADARRVLAHQTRVFDLIAIGLAQVSSPEAAALATRDAYRLLRSRMSPQGLLVHSLDLGHLSPVALASVLAAARASFGSVALEFAETDATLWACDCALGEPPSEEAAGSSTNAKAGNKAQEPSGGQRGWLDTAAVDGVLEAMAAHLGVAVKALGTSDTDLYLAYYGPKAVAQRRDPVQQSLSLLLPFVRKTADEEPPMAVAPVP